MGTEGRSAEIVLAALTQNARKVFKLLLMYQVRASSSRRRPRLSIMHPLPRSMPTPTCLLSHVRGARVCCVCAQLENPGARGLAFPELMKRSKAAFAASNDKALKQHLGEFTTHHLVASRTGVGGQEVLFCTLPTDTMKKVIEGLS